MPTREYYGLLIEINDAAIAAGASASKSARIDARGDFYMQTLSGMVYSTSANGSTIANTPVAGTTSSTQASNTGATLGHFRLMLTLNGIDMFSNPVPLAALLGNNGGEPYYFLTNPMLRPDNEIKATLYNDTPSALSYSAVARLLVAGYKVIN